MRLDQLIKIPAASPRL